MRRRSKFSNLLFSICGLTLLLAGTAIADPPDMPYPYPGKPLQGQSHSATKGAVSGDPIAASSGCLLRHEGSSTQPFTFGGQLEVRREAVAGLYQMGYRYYDAVTERFLTEEPLAPELDNAPALNRYQYAFANPVSFVDALGTTPSVPASTPASNRDATSTGTSSTGTTRPGYVADYGNRRVQTGTSSYRRKYPRPAPPKPPKPPPTTPTPATPTASTPSTPSEETEYFDPADEDYYAYEVLPQPDGTVQLRRLLVNDREQTIVSQGVATIVYTTLPMIRRGSSQVDNVQRRDRRAGRRGDRHCPDWTTQPTHARGRPADPRRAGRHLHHLWRRPAGLRGRCLAVVRRRLLPSVRNVLQCAARRGSLRPPLPLTARHQSPGRHGRRPLCASTVPESKRPEITIARAETSMASSAQKRN